MNIDTAAERAYDAEQGHCWECNREGRVDELLDEIDRLNREATEKQQRLDMALRRLGRIQRAVLDP